MVDYHLPVCVVIVVSVVVDDVLEHAIVERCGAFVATVVSLHVG